MTFKQIPHYVTPPSLSTSLIEEITNIVFGEPMSVKPCDIVFIFGGSHPGLWKNGADAYRKELAKDIVVTGGYKSNALRHHTWQDGEITESEVIRRDLIQLGVPEKSIFIETRSTNTYENVRFALEVYDFSTVSSIFAVGRQTRTLKAQIDPCTQIIPYPFDTHLGGDRLFITKENWMNFQNGQAYMFANVLKIYHYDQTGHLVPIKSMSGQLTAMVYDYFKQ
jgi:hypothetical protein